MEVIFMQTIKIVISGCKAQSVEITEAAKPKAAKDVAKLLYSTPKEMLAEALGINERQVIGHQCSTG